MLSWFRKNFDQVQQANWHYQSRADQKIYQASYDHLAQQLRLEKQAFLRRKIGQLGFREQKDYDGKVVLKNNVPVKRSMALREVQQLVGRLHGGGR